MYFVTLFLCSSVLRWNCDIFSHHLCTLHWNWSIQSFRFWWMFMILGNLYDLPELYVWFGVFGKQEKGQEGAGGSSNIIKDYSWATSGCADYQWCGHPGWWVPLAQVWPKSGEGKSSSSVCPFTSVSSIGICFVLKWFFESL
jgi:hypothetical protein